MIPPEEFTFEAQDRVIPLIRACENAIACGLERMILIKTSKRGPSRRSWDAWRIAPGLKGRVVGSTSTGRWMVDVAVADVVAMLEKIMRVEK